MVSTWAANFEAVQEESPAAADVLAVQCLPRPGRHPVRTLEPRGSRTRGLRSQQALAEAEEDPLLVHDLLRPLARFSLIRIDGRDETYSIHRLVQEVLKAAMDEPTRRLWAERAVRAVDQAFPPVEYGNWPLCGRLLPHALAVASWIERDRMEFAEAGRLLNQTAYYLYERGQYAEAEPLYRQAMEIRRTALGERHPDYAASLNNLAVLYQAMGRHAEAEPLYQQAMEIRRTALGERHPTTPPR